MSLAAYFVQKCAKNLEENVRLVVLQLSDPMSLIHVDVSGVLADAASGNFGPLQDYAQNYLEENAAELLLYAAEEAGVDSKILNAIKLIYDTLALALMANNELIMYFMKKVAEDCLLELDRKDEIIDDLYTNLQALYNALVALNAGDPVWDEYLAQLRSGLALLDKARKDVYLVRNTLDSSNYYLANKFQSARESLDLARERIVPLEEGKNEYLKPTWKGLLKNVGVPDYKESAANIMAIPRISKEVLKSAKGYFETTAKINALLFAFQTGINQLSDLLPDFFKSRAIGLFDNTLDKMDNLVASMAYKVNGSEQAIYTPEEGFTPVPLNVSVNAFKWAMDLELIIQSMKLIPDGALNDLNVSGGAMRAYEDAVASLKAMGDVRAAGAVLKAEEAQETLASMEIQLMLFLIQAQTAIVTASVSPQILSVGKGLLSYMELAKGRNESIRNVLTEFINTPLQLEDTLNKIGDALFEMMGKTGMDRAADLLRRGEFGDFMKLNPATATYVGAGLAAIALLKECFPSPEDEAELTRIQRELERDQDLLNIDISLNFQLAIFDNLQDCIRLEGLSDLFNVKEIVCGLLEASGVGDSFKQLGDILSF